MIVIEWLLFCCCIEQKNYAFSSSLSTSQPASATIDNNGDGVIQVKLSNELEEAMLALIKKEMSETSAIGHVSQRLNARKLTVGF